MQVTDPGTAEWDLALRDLRQGLPSWQGRTLAQRIDLLRSFRRRVGAGASEFIEAYRGVHPVDPEGPWAVEPWGLQVVMAQTARVMERILRSVESGRPPVNRKWIRRRVDGRLSVQVFPMALDDKLLLADYRAETLLSPDVTVEDVIEAAPRIYGSSWGSRGGVALLLGAGNAANLIVSDILHLMYEQGYVVAVKMNPVLVYLRPYMEFVFADFIAGGWLRFVDESHEAGSYLARHDQVDWVHMTGSAPSYDALMWGTDDAAGRKRSGSALLDKEFTAELGGVTPVIVVPGAWTTADIRRQADLIAFSKLFNCGHICGAPQVLVLPDGWPQADALVNEIRAYMLSLEPRAPYYPGSGTKVARVLDTHRDAEVLQGRGGRVLVPHVDPGADSCLFAEEVFADVLAVVRLPAPSLQSYLDRAVEFVNERLSGDLSSNVLVDPRTARQETERVDGLVTGLASGTVGVNEWAILATLTGSSAWGGFPGNTPADIGSGTGKVLNPLCLPEPEKSVMTGTFRPLIKPPRSLESRTAVSTYRRLLEYFTTDDVRRLPGVALAAMQG